MSEKVRFVEVGSRDGIQSWPQPVSTPVKIELVRAALAAGVPRVEATSMVHPKWVPQMADAEEVMKSIPPDDMPRIRVLVPNLKGYDRAVAAGARNVLVNVGVTDGFNQHNLNRTVAETIEDIKQVADAGARDGVRVDASLSVVWGCPYDGPVTPHQVMRVAGELSDLAIAEFAFGDTIGVATPSGVTRISEIALEHFADREITMHFHDTRGMGLANGMAALQAGVRGFEGSIGGIGGCPFAPNSTGNVCSEDLLAMIADLGYETGIDTDRMVEAARALGRALDAELPGRLQRAGPAPWLVA